MANNFMVPTIESLFKFNEENNLRSFSTFIIFVVLAFLSLTNNIKNLKFSALYGFYSIIAMVLGCLIMIMYNSYTELRVNSLYFVFNYSRLSSLNINLSQISIIVLSFSFHTYTFSIYETIEKPTTKKMMICTSVGILISMMVYLMVGGIIYISYGEILLHHVNVVSVINKSSIGILINIAFSINVIMSFPMSFFSVKSYTLYVLPLIWNFLRGLCSNCLKSKEINQRNSKELDDQEINDTTSNNSKEEADKKHSTNSVNDDVDADIHSNNHNHDIDNSHDHGHNAHAHEELPYLVNLLTTIILFAIITFICFQLQESKYVSSVLIFNLLKRSLASWDHLQPI